MQPTSPAQFDAAQRGERPTPDEVRPGIWSLALAMPEGRPSYSFCYVILGNDDQVHVVDPGWPSSENFAELDALIARIAPRRNIADVSTVTATHLHPDHLGMAERVRAASGARLVLHAVEQHAGDAMSGHAPADAATDPFDEWNVPDERRAELDLSGMRSAIPPMPTADLVLANGDALPIAGRDIRLLHTPGHTPGHVCLVDAANQLIFTGDHVMPQIFGGLGLGGATDTNPIADYLDSLDRTAVFDAFEAAPGHEYRFHGLAERCEASAEHHLRRSREVAAALGASRPGDALGAAGTPDVPGATEATGAAGATPRCEPTVWQIASTLTWTAGWENLSGFNLRSALAQTALHVQFVRSEAGERRLA